MTIIKKYSTFLMLRSKEDIDQWWYDHNLQHINSCYWWCFARVISTCHDTDTCLFKYKRKTRGEGGGWYRQSLEQIFSDRNEWTFWGLPYSHPIVVFRCDSISRFGVWEWVSQRESLSQIIDTLIIEHWMSIEYTLNKYKNIAKHGAIKDIVRCYRI